MAGDVPPPVLERPATPPPEATPPPDLFGVSSESEEEEVAPPPVKKKKSFLTLSIEDLNEQRESESQNIGYTRFFITHYIYIIPPLLTISFRQP